MFMSTLERAARKAREEDLRQKKHALRQLEAANKKSQRALNDMLEKHKQSLAQKWEYLETNSEQLNELVDLNSLGEMG